MSKRRRERHKEDLAYSMNDSEFMEESNAKEKKPQMGHFKLKDIKPITQNQEKAFMSYYGGKNVVLHGVAGTGKTYISMYLALKDVMRNHYREVIVCRSIVPTRDIGFMPGTLDEKIKVYETPYMDICSDICQKAGSYEHLKKQGLIQFTTTSFIRGLTFDNCVLIIDEAQNLVDHEISSVLTRVGENCKVIVCGDFRQSDLNMQKKSQDSGIYNLMKIARKMPSFDIVEFRIEDIVRSGFVKEFILARISAGIDDV